MTFKTTELTLGEVLLIKRISDGDISAVPELLLSRAENPADFDPLTLSISESAKMLEQIMASAQEHADEVGAFIAKIKP